MRTPTLWLVALLAATVAAPVCAAADSEMAEMRRMIEQMRADYETRISRLEQRLVDAEQDAARARSQARAADQRAERAEQLAQQAEQAAGDAQSTAKAAEKRAGDNAEQIADAETAPRSGLSEFASGFNPAISLVLQGTATSYQNDPDSWSLPGFQLGGETGRKPEGLSLDESEISFSANVDDWFYGQATIAFHQDDDQTEIDLEEAFVDTLSLPYGLGARFGRFYSDVAFQNPIHSHAWDFTDAPLAYDAFLGKQYRDDGVRASWVAPTDLFLEFGVEAYRGNNFPGGDSNNSDGVLGGLHNAFVRAGGDFNVSNSWKIGLSHLRVKPEDRESGHAHGHGHDEDEGGTSFDGDSNLTVASALWKWAPDGNTSHRYFTLEAEYFYRDEDGTVSFSEDGDTALMDYDGSQQGVYVQGVYQFMPKWRAGVRYDRLWSDNKLNVTDAGGLDPEEVEEESGLLGDHDPSRWTAMLDYSHSEFSRFRLQYEYDKSTPNTDQVWMLQYIMTLGAHGAHAY